MPATAPSAAAPDPSAGSGAAAGKTSRRSLEVENLSVLFYNVSKGRKGIGTMEDRSRRRDRGTNSEHTDKNVREQLLR